MWALMLYYWIFYKRVRPVNSRYGPLFAHVCVIVHAVHRMPRAIREPEWRHFHNPGWRSISSCTHTHTHTHTSLNSTFRCPAGRNLRHEVYFTVISSITQQQLAKQIECPVQYAGDDSNRNIWRTSWGGSENQSVSGVTTIYLTQCNTSSSHKVDQVVDCGL